MLSWNMTQTITAFGESSETLRLRMFATRMLCCKRARNDHSLTEDGMENRWFIITMSTGVVSILLHQLPYNGHWLQIISVIFFVFNICLFVVFTVISCIRYTLYPQTIPAVLRHPHQSLFLATFPVGLATLINMIVLVCVPVWGHGMATFAWVLWWIDSLLALATCFHLTYVMFVCHFSASSRTNPFLLRMPMSVGF